MSTGFNNNVDALFNRVESFVTSKTVVGEPIYIGGIILLPLVDVSFGMGVGAFDKDDSPDKSKAESGGGGVGAKITPSAVIAVVNGQVQLVNVKNQDSINKLIDLAPGVLAKLDFGPFAKKKDECSEEEKAKNVNADGSEIGKE